MHQFNEHHPELKGFSEYFFHEIFPFLEDRDSERQLGVARVKKYAAFVLIAAVIFSIVAVLIKFPPQIYILIIILSLVSILGIYAKELNSLESYTKEKIVGGICDYVGWQFRSVTPRPNLILWSALKLIPKGYESASNSGQKRTKVEDEIKGQAHGASFKSVEVLLERDSGDDKVTDFRGQLMSITFPRKFLGRTIVLRDKGFLQGKKKGDMKRVGLVDPVFEKIFEAYSTDQVEARYLLTPVFMQTLVDLERSVQGKNIRFGFDQNKLFIAVETGNRYESGSMLEPLTNPARTQKILDEIGAIYDVVDIVSRAKRG